MILLPWLLSSTITAAPTGTCCDTKHACGDPAAVCHNATSWCGQSEANCNDKCKSKWCPNAPPAPTAPPTPSPPLTAVRVNSTSSAAIHTLSDRYISFTLDCSKIGRAAKQDGVWQDPQNFTSPEFAALAKEFAPAYLRFGGTCEDFLTYDMSPTPPDGSIERGTPSQQTLTRKMYDEVVTWAAGVGWSLVFGLNLLTNTSSIGGEWNSTNARSLMTYTHKQGYDVVGWELGNEQDLPNKGLPKPLSPLPPKTYALAYGKLRSLIEEIYGASGAGSKTSPWLIGPDTTKSHAAYASSVLSAVLETTETHIDVMTWHHYYLAGAGSTTKASAFATVPYLNTFSTFAASYEALYHEYVGNLTTRTQEKENKNENEKAQAKTPQLWMGETGGAGGATATAAEVTGKFLGCFWWADKLGTAAYTGHTVVARQEWTELVQQVGKNKEATILIAPSFWTALLWKRLVGPSVLHLAAEDASGPQPPVAIRTGEVRYYAFSAAAGSGKSGKVVFVVVNLATTKQTLPLVIDGDTSPAGQRWSLTAGATPGVDVSTPDIYLNNVKMALSSDGTVPEFAGASIAKGEKITVEPQSVTFLSFP